MDVDEARSVRCQVLRRLVEGTGADGASFHRLIRAGEAVYVSEPCAVGSDALVEAFARLDGQPQAKLAYDVAHAPPLDVFALHRRAEVPDGVRDGLWRALDIADAIATNLTRDHRLLGTLFLYRNDGRERFDAADVTSANELLRWARARLDEAHDVTSGRSLGGSWVFDVAGRLLFGPADAAGERAEALGREARAFSGGGARRGCVAGHLVTLQRLVGPSGPAVLVDAIEGEPLVLDDVMQLTPLKRRIAAFAAQGATVPEIARTLGRSPETVRTHLKKIYQHLGVASRVELAQACLVPWR